MRSKVFLILCLSFSLFLFTQPNLAAADELFLTSEKSFTAQLKTSEIRTFFLRAEAGEFYEIVGERSGADIGLTAFSPANERISVSNAPAGFAGSDHLVFVAATAGVYKIEAASRRPGNFTGNFTIRIKRKKIADENDRTLFEAMRTLGAVRDSISGLDERLQKAENAGAALQKSLILFEKIGDLRGQAFAFYHLAEIYSNEFGNEKAAIEHFEKSLAVWKNLDDPAGLAICLTGAANEYRLNGQNEKAENYFKRAIEINQTLNNPRGAAVTDSFFCRFYNDTGAFQKGFEKCRESLKLTGQNDPLTDHFTFQALAALSGNTGDVVNAERNIFLAFEAAKKVEKQISPIRLARIQANIGGLFYIKGEYQKSIENYRGALEISEKLNRPVFSAIFLIQLGENFYALKDYEKSVELGERALALYRKHDPRRRQLALNFLGKSYDALYQTEKARENLLEAVSVNRQNKDLYAEAECLHALAKLEKNVGNLEAAHAFVRRAVQNMEIIRADLLGKNQRISFNSVLKTYYELEIETLIAQYENSAEPRFLEQAWQKHEKMRARSLLENFVENGLNINELAAREVFEKEKTLLEKISAAENSRFEAEKNKNRAALENAERDLQNALDELQIFQEDLRRRNPKFSELNQTKEFTFSDVQQTLNEKDALIEFSVGENQTLAWLIKKREVKLLKLAPRAALKQATLAYYDSLSEKTVPTERTLENAKKLSRLTLAPLKDDLKEVETLLVVPDGALYLVPFSTLTLTPEKEFEPLIEITEIVRLPSFASFAYAREARLARAATTEKLLAIIADPIFNPDDERLNRRERAKPGKPARASADKLAETLRDFGIEKLSRLPFTNFEAKEIQKFAPQSTTLALGEDASRRRFLNGEFESYKILHFATHGFLNQRNPDLSGLVLSLYDGKRQPQNGFLRVIDLYSMRLNADLVVLSACQTGLGKEIEGEGIIGLTHGFMFAGAARVVSSLWKVEDAATAELMKRFYREMLKNNQTPAAALRRAQREMRAIPRFQNPRYWAGFTLNGDWN